MGEPCRCEKLNVAVKFKRLGLYDRAVSEINFIIDEVTRNINNGAKLVGVRCRCSDLATLFNEKGQLHYLMVDFDTAVDNYTKAIDLNPQFEIAYYNRGQIHYRMGRFLLAFEDFNKTLSLNYAFEDAHEALRSTEKELSNAKT